MSKDVENISKIRDILFGNNLTELERRLQKTEETLRQQFQNTDSKLNEHIDNTKIKIDNTFEKIAGRLEEEKNRHETGISVLQEEIQQLKSFVNAFKDEVAREQFAMKRIFEEQLNQLSKQQKQVSENMQSQLLERIEELRGSKVERSALAVLLSDIAMQLVEKDSEKSEDKLDTIDQNQA
ncbi:MAG: hypothetical protein KG029_04940 [Bacteroidetes bacterium]|nr:hypothetical protein [Bacteroidota bacterium]